MKIELDNDYKSSRNVVTTFCKLASENSKKIKHIAMNLEKLDVYNLF